MTITEKIDAVTGLTPETRNILPPAPRSVKVELTNRCNFNCSFCATNNGLRPKGDMSPAMYEMVLDELVIAGVKEMGMFFLGESFLLPHLPDYIQKAKDKGLEYVFVTTNGVLSTDKMVFDCMYAGLDSLKFSLNYANEEQFAEISGVKASLFEIMIRNIKEAHTIREAYGFSTKLYASYIQYDGEQGERMDALLEELTPFLDETYALPLYSQADFVGESEEERGWEVKAGNPGRAGNMRDPLPCWSLFTEGRITYDGKIAACCFDHDGRFEMGDLNKETFMEAWHSEKFQSLRQAHLDLDVTGTACEGCVAYG